MDRPTPHSARVMRAEMELKAALQQEQEQSEPATQNQCAATVGRGIGGTSVGPREVLLADIHDQEQRCLDRLSTLSTLREMFQFTTLAEAELLLKMDRLVSRLKY